MANNSPQIQPSMPATEPRVVLTLSAARRVHELLMEEGDEHLKLRVSIEGGGCSGFQYKFKFDAKVRAGDQVITRLLDDDEEGDGGSGGDTHVELLIDPLSYQYLLDAQIDYENTLEGERFVIRNPNATVTCGCGSSFSV